MDPRKVPEIVQKQADLLKFNAETLEILGGNLGPYVDHLMQCQLSPQSYYQAKNRLAPINIFPKVIDKLTNIYQTSVLRIVDDGTATDQKIKEYYEEKTNMNQQMNCNNELFNSCGAALLQPYAYKGQPWIRSIPNDKFVVYSEDQIQPNKPTHVILIYKGQDDKKYFHVWGAKETYIVDQDGNYDAKAMINSGMVDYRTGQISTVNPFGRIPFTYVNSSKYLLIPIPDQDGMTIIKLIPVMLSDLNHAANFQCFSMLYTIDAGEGAVKFAPNAVMQLETDPRTGQKPQVGDIKPTVDYPQVLQLIESQLSMWLGTKGIRASTIGGLTQDNFASGISKVIDEMDTFEARQKQVAIYQEAEADYWDLIINHMHPYWVNNKQIENVGLFSVNAKVKTQFAVQLPMQTRGQVVTDLKSEYEAGFISRKKAIMKLNPELSEQEIDQLIKEIDEERTIEVPQDNQDGILKDAQEPQDGSLEDAQDDVAED